MGAIHASVAQRYSVPMAQAMAASTSTEPASAKARPPSRCEGLDVTKASLIGRLQEGARLGHERACKGALARVGDELEIDAGALLDGLARLSAAQAGALLDQHVALELEQLERGAQ